MFLLCPHTGLSGKNIILTFTQCVGSRSVGYATFGFPDPDPNKYADPRKCIRVQYQPKIVKKKFAIKISPIKHDDFLQKKKLNVIFDILIRYAFNFKNISNYKIILFSMVITSGGVNQFLKLRIIKDLV